MSFEAELRSVLPPDLPHRDALIRRSARHLERISETNTQFNLTRIVSPREAAIKHVLDSVLPWRHFRDAVHIVDAGTGAGFPGIPLALLLPDTRFTLAESVGKKARFVASVIEELGLSNVAVANQRAEDALKPLHDVKRLMLTGRAVAPLVKACALFGPAIRAGALGFFYKGPDADSEMAEAAAEARKQRVRLKLADRYELPEGYGARTLIGIAP